MFGLWLALGSSTFLGQLASPLYDHSSSSRLARDFSHGAGDGGGDNSKSKSKSLHGLLERPRLGTVFCLIIMIMLMAKRCNSRKGYKIKK